MHEQAGQQFRAMSTGREQVPSSERGWFLMVGGGLVVSGAVAAVVGLVTEVRPGRGAFPGLAVFGAILVALTLVGVLVGSIRLWRDRHASASRVLVRRRWAMLALVLAILVAGYSWWQALVDVGGGMVTLALPLFASGLSVAVGSALITVAPGGSSAARPLVTIGVVAAAAVLGGAVAVVSAAVVERLPVNATTSAATEPVFADGVPAQMLWSWETPAGEQLRWDDIVAMPTGVAVRVSDGVVALDAETGEQVWQYRRSGARAWSIAASPSGAWVIVTLGSGSSDDGGVRVMAFDGRTGAVGFDELAAGGSPFGGVRLDLTDDILLGGSPSDGRYTGFALEDGERLWDWQVPDNCHVGDNTFGTGTAASTVLVALVCVAEEQDSDRITGAVTFIGLDSRSGEQLWRSAYPFTREETLNPSSPPLENVYVDADVRVSADGAVARLGWNVRGEQNFSSVLADTGTGEELSTDRVELGWLFDGVGILRLANGEYTLIRLDDGAAGTVSSGCEHVTTSRVAATDALVALCLPEDYTEGTPLTIVVTPWDDPSERHEFEVDLGPYAEGGTVDTPYLAKLPAVMVAILGGGTRLTALG